jgi:hypothetical protein
MYVHYYVPYHEDMKTWWSGGKATQFFILRLGRGWSGPFCIPAALPPGMGGPQNRSGRCEERKILPLPVIEPQPFSPSV